MENRPIGPSEDRLQDRKAANLKHMKQYLQYNKQKTEAKKQHSIDVERKSSNNDYADDIQDEDLNRTLSNKENQKT